MRIGRILRRVVITPFTQPRYLFERRLLPAGLDELRYDTPVRLSVPFHLGLGQAVHPDILGPDGSGGPFVLTMTPYPFEDGREENPCLLVSPDGLRFAEEVAGLNPLVPPPPVDHNDDPDLVLVGGTYHLLYLETLRPRRQNLVLLSSRDRITWERRTIAVYELDLPHPDPFIVSPALALQGDDLFLYYVNTSTRPYRIEYLTSRVIDRWDIHSPSIPTIAGGPVVPWHIDIVDSQGVYYLLISDVAQGRRGSSVHLCRSDDLVHWSEPRNLFDGMPFGCRGVYRSTALVRGGDLFVYFSYESRLGEWKLAVVRKRARDVLGEH